MIPLIYIFVKFLEVKSMDKAAKAARAAYQRNWRKRNPDRVREINERYWMRRAEKELIKRASETGAEQ